MTPRKIVVIAWIAALAATPLLAQAQDDEPTADQEREESSAWLGVRPQRIEGGLAEALNLEADSGVLVAQVVEDSPAEKAGLESGDIILAVDKSEVGTPAELVDAVRDRQAGDRVSIHVLRNGKSRDIDVTLAEAPEFAELDERMEGLPPQGMDRMRRHLDRVRELRLPGKHGFLGVVTQPVEGDLAEYFGAGDGGVLVSEVVEDSPAAKLGLRAGDVIVKVGDETVEDPEELRRAVGQHDEGEEVEVTWIRDKHRESGRVALEVREGPRVFGWSGDDGEGEFEWHDGGPHFDGEALRDLRRRAGDAHVRIERLYDESEIDEALTELRAQMDELRKEIEELKGN